MRFVVHCAKTLAALEMDERQRALLPEGFRMTREGERHA